jgi:hypothetical protein
MGSSRPALHIVLGESAGGTLRVALRQAHRDGEVLSFNDDLSFGPIDPPVPMMRAAWAKTELCFPDEATAALHDTLDRHWDPAVSAEKRVIWFSRRTAREFCGFLELVSRMGRQEYEVVDLSSVGVPYRTGNGGSEKSRAILGLAEISPDAVRENALWDRAVSLSDGECQHYRRSWRRLRRENAPFRVLDGDAVVSAPIEIYDDVVLSCVTADWCRTACIVGEAMARSLHEVGDLVLFGRLRKLIEAGKLDARGDLETIRGSEVRLARR